MTHEPAFLHIAFNFNVPPAYKGNAPDKTPLLSHSLSLSLSIDLSLSAHHTLGTQQL
jgi:hypothetical protein